MQTQNNPATSVASAAVNNTRTNAALDSSLNTVPANRGDNKAPDNLELYDKVTSTLYFQTLSNTIKERKNTRNRITFPSRDLEATWLSDLSREQTTWLKRVYHHSQLPVEDHTSDDDEYTESEGDVKDEKGRESKGMSLDTLFTHVLDPATLDRYFTFMRASFNSGERRLLASTYRRSYHQLTTGVRTLGGGRNLSRLSPPLRIKARTTLDKLSDLAATWNSLSAISNNETEESRLRYNQGAPDKKEIMKKLYYLLQVERLWYNYTFSDNKASKDIDDLKYAVGFAMFTFILARPVTRASVWRAVTLEQVKSVLEAGSDMTLYLTQHKTAKSFKTLVMYFPVWACNILSTYLRVIRPMLIKKRAWGKGSTKSFFPQEAITYLSTFLQVSSKISMSQNQIRSIICDIIGDIEVDDTRWGRHRATLQSTAAHSPSSMIQTHYELSTKPQRERILQQYLETEFHIPARAILNRQLTTVNQSDYMTSPFVGGEDEGSESDTVTEPDPSSSSESEEPSHNRARLLTLPSLPALPTILSSSQSTTSRTRGSMSTPRAGLERSDSATYDDFDTFSSPSTYNDTKDDTTTSITHFEHDESSVASDMELGFPSFDDTPWSEPHTEAEEKYPLSKPAKNPTLVQSYSSSDNDSSGAEEFRRLKRQLSKLKRKRKNRDVSKRKRHGDISEKHKKSNKYSKRHSKKHKKQKTVKAVTNTRTKCQNKVNGKRCFSNTTIQNFSEEGQIFCDECKKVYRFSGGWTRKRYNEYMTKTKKRQERLAKANTETNITDSQKEKDSDDEQTDTSNERQE